MGEPSAKKVKHEFAAENKGKGEQKSAWQVCVSLSEADPTQHPNQGQDDHNVTLTLIEPDGSKTNFGSSMVPTPQPAYKALLDGFNKSWRKASAKLPGPEKVVQTIYRAALDGLARRMR